MDPSAFCTCQAHGNALKEKLLIDKRIVPALHEAQALAQAAQHDVLRFPWYCRVILMMCQG